MKSLRIYGQPPFRTAVLHGGPGAPGEMAPVARELAAGRGVLEPLQAAPTIAGQLRELEEAFKSNGEPPITLIGFSWGAMLGFIFTATHRPLVKKLILIGSGVFEEKYAAGITPTRLKRLSRPEREEALALMEALSAPAGDKGAAMARLGELLTRTDSYDTLPHESEVLAFQEDIYRSIWAEAQELRRSGELLALGRKIRCPVVAIHGDYDPHPTAGVEEPLSAVLADFRFILLRKCGHYPWRERDARDLFYRTLEDEIDRPGRVI